ncbi:hypothetical protein LZ30DRAFT_713335 [Colletotrichum cereale]|nr:hypothetical protein LZ30DRAFT_713335 [Colletotrichum cereale]
MATSHPRFPRSWPPVLGVACLFRSLAAIPVAYCTVPSCMPFSFLAPSTLGDRFSKRLISTSCLVLNLSTFSLSRGWAAHVVR